MAEPTIKARATLDASGYAKGVKQVQAASSGFKKVGTVAAGVFGGNLLTSAAGQAKNFFSGAIKGALDAEKANVRFSTTLQNLGFAKQIPAAQEFLSTLSKQTAVAKGEIRPAFETLLTTTRNYGKAQTATRLAMDIAAAKGKDLGQVSTALGRAFLGNTTALGKLGVKVKGTVPDVKALAAATARQKAAQDGFSLTVAKFGPKSEQAKAAYLKLVGANKAVADAQGKTKKSALGINDVMKDLAKTFGGQASKQANTAAGRMKNAQLQFKAFQVTVGQALMPVLTQLVQLLTSKLLPVVQAMSSWVKKNPGLFKILAIAIVALVVGFKLLNAIMAISNAIAAASIWVLIVFAIIALVAAVILAYNKVGWFRAAVDALGAAIKVAFDFIVAAATIVVNFFRDHWKLILVSLTGPFAIAILLIMRYWEGFKQAIMIGVAFVQKLWEGLKIYFSIWVRIISTYIKTVIAVFNTIKGAVQAVVGFVTKTWDSLTGVIRTVANRVVSIIEGMVSAMKAPINLFIRAWNAIEFKLPSIKLPKVGPFGGGTIGGFTIGVPDIPQLATGGRIMSDGLAYLHAAEVVVPAPAAGGTTGPVVWVENANFSQEVDVDMFMRRVAWTLRTQGVA